MKRLSLIVGILLAITGFSAPGYPHDGHTDVIDGRLSPERLPEESVWDHVFAAIHDLTGGKTDIRDPDVQAFVRGNLYLSDADSELLLRHVSAERTRIEEIESRLRTSAGPGATADEQSRLREEIGRVTLQARDGLLRDLSPRGAKALLRWVAIAKRGMKHGPPPTASGVAR